MIGVDLRLFLGCELVHIHQRDVVREQRQVLKLHKAAEIVGCAVVNGQNAVFDAHSIAAGKVKSWFVAGYHARLEHHRIFVSANALRTFVNAQEVAHAVSGAVEIGHALIPEELTGKHIELYAACTFGEYGSAECQVTL